MDTLRLDFGISYCKHMGKEGEEKKRKVAENQQYQISFPIIARQDIIRQLRARRALSLYKVYGDSALLVLNGTSLNSDSALLALNWRY